MPEAMPAPPEPDARPIVDTDFRCVACGYNLRTLNRKSVCPECGTSISWSEAELNNPVWSRRFRRGVIALGIAMIAQFFVVQMLYSWRPFYWWLFSHHANLEGTQMLFEAATLEPAAIWLTQRGSRRRHWITAGLAALALTGILCVSSFLSSHYASDVALLGSYGMGPVFFALCMFTLLGPISEAVGHVPNTLPRWIVEGLRYLLTYVLLAGALEFAVISFARIKFISAPPPPIGGSFVGPGLGSWMNKWLAPHLSFALREPAWLAMLIVIIHTYFRLRGFARRAGR